MTDRTLTTTTLTGVDNADLNRKQWEWQISAKVTIAKIWPDEHLPRKMRSPQPHAKIVAQDQFSRRIDYYKG